MSNAAGNATPRRVVKGVLAALLLSVAVPAGASAQTLADTLVTAYTNSPEITSQRASVKVFGERAVQAASFGRPTVSGTASAEIENRNFDDTVFPLGLQLEVVQSLYTGGQVANSTEAAEKRITAEEVRLRATEQEVLLNAATAFFNVRRGYAFVDLGINNVRVLTEQLRAANERFEVGEVTRTDVEQARSRLAAARSQLAAARGSLATAKEAYLRVVGAPAIELAPPPPLPEVPDSLSDAVGIALRNAPTLLASRIDRDAAGSDVRAAIGALLPQVSLQANVSRFEEGNSSFGDEDARASLGLIIEVPFYTGGRNYSGVREAQAVVEQTVSNITASERNTVQDVGVAWSDLEVAKASIEAGKLEVSAAALAFDGVQEEAKVGARTTLDVLDAEQELLNARADLIQSQRDESVATYSLLAAMGKLSVEHLGLDVDPGDAESYYSEVRDRNFGYDRTEDTVWQHTLRP